MQGALLDVLGTSRSVDVARARLAADPAFAPFADWIASFEPRGVEVAMEIVQRWGARDVAPGPGCVRAAVLTAPHALVEIRDVPLPSPGAGQVRIRVAAAGVCGTDVHAWEGRYRLPLPIVCGHVPVGTIDAVGEGVAPSRVGERVGVPWTQAGCGACPECARGRAKYCAAPRTWITNGGGFVQAMIAEAAGAVPLPDGLAFEHAAPLLCAGYTAMSGLRRGAPRPGERVAVLGIGGLGHLALQIARAHACETLAVTSSEGKRRDALALGADDVLLVTGHAGRALRDAGGADVILATSSDARATSEIASGLRPEGRLVLMGLGEDKLAIDPMTLIARQASIVGSMQDDRTDLHDVLQLAADGRVVPRVEHYGLPQIMRALHRLREGRVRYRAVLGM
jgi:D-arabinose 1-dehydrogenase-like Zn-dependent alcohol dehydrogenase